jgi:phage terminase small subunit
MAATLTPKQAAFVAEYLIDLNSTQAAIRAGYSARTADRIGPELLGKTCVAAAILEAGQKRAAKLGRTAEDVVRDIQAVTAQAREEGDLKTALKGLELEGRHHGVFNDKLKLDADVHVLNIHRRHKPAGDSA